MFDAAYEFGRGAGSEGGMTGTAEEVGRELSRYLASLTPRDIEDMKYKTDRFFVELTITPLPGAQNT